MLSVNESNTGWTFDNDSMPRLSKVSVWESDLLPPSNKLPCVLPAFSLHQLYQLLRLRTSQSRNSATVSKHPRPKGRLRCNDGQWIGPSSISFVEQRKRRSGRQKRYLSLERKCRRLTQRHQLPCVSVAPLHQGQGILVLAKVLRRHQTFRM